MAPSGAIFSCLKLLYPGHAHHLLIVQDIRQGVTRLLATTPALQAVLEKTSLPIQRKGTSLESQLPGIVMRKSILNAVLQIQK